MPASGDGTVDEGDGARDETVQGAVPIGPDKVVLPAPYVFRRELSRGGMGRVLIAWDERLGREVAIKLIRGAAPELRGRFEREALLTARLQHPAIVPIYDAGQLSDGEPFYAMRLVSGRTLTEVLANRRLRARLGLLPQVIAAVDALAYAHDRHIVHRDLKPQNILVGGFGETVVIDWGLAKDLVEHAGQTETAPTVGSSDSGLTQSGQVMGTPAYMPPEQARGEEVDERADVYSLGAVLYHVLVGEAPYLKSSAAEVLAEVLSAPPVDVAVREPDAPRDLVDVVRKAMAREPRQRYATAAELAEDLKRYQTGQLVAAHRYSILERVRRFTARQRAAVVVGAVLLATLLGTTVVGLRRITRARDLAEANGREAQRARVSAESLVRYLLSELAVRLERLGRVDVLKGLGEAIIAHQTDQTSQEPTRSRAQALQILAAAEGPHGNLATAQRALDASIVMRRSLLAVHPDDVTLRAELWRAEAERAALELHHGKLPVASVFAARSGEAEALANEPRVAADAEATAILAEVLNLVAAIHIQEGKHALAVEDAQKAVALASRAVALLPADLRHQRTLAACRSMLGSALDGNGRVVEAMAESRLALTLFNRLVRERPFEPGLQLQLMLQLRELAELDMLHGRFAEGRALVTRSVEVAEGVARLDPDNAEWRLARIDAWIHAARVDFDKGVYPAARSAFEHAATLLAAEASSPELDENRASIEGYLGWIDVLGGAPERAVPRMREASRVFDLIAARAPDDGSRQREAMTWLSDLAYAELQAGQAADAEAHLQKAVAIYAHWRKQASESREWQYQATFVHGWLGGALGQLGRRAEAETAFKAALALAKPLVANDTNADEPEVHAALAEVCYWMLRSDPKTAEARQIMRREVVVLRRLQAEDKLYASAAIELDKWDRISQ